MDFFTGKRPFFILEIFLDQLPKGSKTKAKIANNEDIANLQLQGLTDDDIQRIVDQKAEKADEDDIPIEDYDLYTEKLNQIIDQISLLTFVTKQALGGKKDKDLKPTPRPKTAVDKGIERLVWEFEKRQNDDLLSDFGF